MSTQVTLTIPDEVYQRAKRIARSKKRAVADVLVEAISLPAPTLETDPAVDREETAFHRLHAELRRDYPDEYVAIHNETLVDHDRDQVALYQRVRRRFAGQFVWIAPVRQSPDEAYQIYSPRLLHDKDA